MFVCICNGISDKDLRASFDEGARTAPELQMKTGCGTCCGSCLEMLDELVNEWGPSVPYTPPQASAVPAHLGANILAFEPHTSTRLDICSMTNHDESGEIHKMRATPKIA